MVLSLFMYRCISFSSLCIMRPYCTFFFFFFNDTATTEIYTLSLHDALPISVVPRAALDGVDAGARHEPHEIARLEPEVLHPQVTGHVVAHLAERRLEVGAQQPRLVAQHEIFERIEHARGDPANLRILGVPDRQLLLEHEHARGDRRHQVVAGLHRPRQRRGVVIPYAPRPGPGLPPRA